MPTSNGFASLRLRIGGAIVAATVWCIIGQMGLVSRAQGAEAPAEIVKRIFLALEAISAEVPRGTFDPQAIVEKAGRDPAKLFEWVRDETLWVPYLGELRGPAGVLMDRVGNSLDRSLLLAELLRLAGHKVRLAHASLTEQQAGELLSRLRAAPKGGLVTPGEDVSDAAVERVTKKVRELGFPEESLKGPSPEVQRESAQRLARATEGLSKVTPLVLEAAGKMEAREEAAARAAAIRCLRDHWWVQVEMAGAWADADPLPANARMGDACARAAQTLAPGPADGNFRLDAKLVHRATVRVVVEQLKRGKLTEHVVLKHELRPCESVGQAIGLRHVPLDWPKDLDASKEADLKKALLAQTQWLPALFIGEKVVFQSAFTMFGDAVDKPEPNPAAQMGKQAAGKLGGFAGILGGDDDDEPATPPKPEGLLTAEWVDYELSRPGEKPQTVRREVFDLLGPAARAAGAPNAPRIDNARQLDRAFALLGETRMLALPCNLSPQFFLHLAVRQWLDAKDKLLKVAQEPDRDRRRELAGEAMNPPFGVGLTHGWALERRNLCPVRGEVYLDSLNVLTHATDLRQDAKGSLAVRERIDVVANPVAVLGTSPENPVTVRVRQGLADTAAEGLVLDHPDSKGSMTTVSVFALASASQVPLRVLRPSGEPDWGQADLAPDVRARVGQDLAAGYLVVLPAKQVLLGETPRLGWFRVHPATGETLGVMDDGFHTGTEDTLIRANPLLKHPQWFMFQQQATCLLAAMMNPNLSTNQLAFLQRQMAVLIISMKNFLNR
jgi:hypothetical protein